MIDVANLAGVSKMTVSRVLNRGPNVTDDMRKRVSLAMESLRYQPNELARSLRERRSRQIGVLVPYLFDPFFASCAHAISSVAQQHSYSVVLSTTNEDPKSEFEEASRMLRRGMEGLIIVPANSKGEPSLLLEPEFEDLPIVTIDRPIDGSRFDSLLVENERGAEMGTEHLLKLGHKRIAYIGLTDSLYTMRMRHRGYTSAMAARGVKTQEVFLSRILDDALGEMRKLLSGRSAPTALFTANNLITRHVLHALQALGMHPPESIALVGFDDFEVADLLRPGITVVRQPIEQLGRTAAELLFKRLNTGTRPKTGKRTTLPVDLVVRGSCGTKHKTVSGS